MEADLARVETALRGAVRTEDEYLTELASHLIVAGGKRLRPVVAMAAAGTRGAVTDDVVQGGVSVELVHLGSLYHDDVMDEADTRRGVETVNAKWGNLQAILAGDFLLSRASEIAASLADQVREAGAPVEVLVMEDYGPRPMLTLPPPIASALERAHVSIYAGQPKEGELAFRRALTEIIDRRKIRHAHMVSISHRIMVEATAVLEAFGGRARG